MQNIIHATANEETQMPELPGMDDVFGGFLRLAGTVVMSFGLPIGLLVANYYDVDMPVSAILITVHPWLFLFSHGVSGRGDEGQCHGLQSAGGRALHPARARCNTSSPSSCSPASLAFNRSETLLSSGTGLLAFTTTDSVGHFPVVRYSVSFWNLASVYLLTVNMRIMGLLYLTQKEKLGWY